jgi:hypothetical protein
MVRAVGRHPVTAGPSGCIDEPFGAWAARVAGGLWNRVGLVRWPRSTTNVAAMHPVGGGDGETPAGYHGRRGNYRCEPRRRVPCTATSVADTEPQRLGAGSAPGPTAPDLVSADGRRANSAGRFVLVAGVRGPLGGRLT